MKYPYEPHRDRLMKMAKAGDLDPRRASSWNIATPAPEAAAATIGAYLQLLPKGSTGQPSRATDATIFCAERSRVHHDRDTTFDWLPRRYLRGAVHGTRCPTGPRKIRCYSAFRPSPHRRHWESGAKRRNPAAALRLSHRFVRWKPPSLPRPLSPHGSCRRRGTLWFQRSATAGCSRAGGGYLAATLAGQRGTLHGTFVACSLSCSAAVRCGGGTRSTELYPAVLTFGPRRLQYSAATLLGFRLLLSAGHHRPRK